MKTLLTAAVLICALVVSACNQKPIYNAQNIQIRQQGLSMQETEQAIVRAGAQRGWTFERLGSGQLLGRLDKRGKHTVIVDVTFDAGSFSILYKNSTGMKYEPENGIIHRGYNTWVKNLENDIQREIAIAANS